MSQQCSGIAAFVRICVRIRRFLGMDYVIHKDGVHESWSGWLHRTKDDPNRMQGPAAYACMYYRVLFSFMSVALAHWERWPLAFGNPTQTSRPEKRVVFLCKPLVRELQMLICTGRVAS